MDKRGIGIGQVFMFIVVALTFVVIMIFGYKAISDFLQGGEDIGYVQFKNEIEGAVKRIYTEYGSVRIEKFRLPAKYEQVCFINLDYSRINEALDKLCLKDVVACSVWEDALAAQTASNELGAGYKNADINVFLKPDAPKIKVHHIDLRDADENKVGFLCLPIRKGTFSIRMEGKGDHTLLSPAPVQN